MVSTLKYGLRQVANISIAVLVGVRNVQSTRKVTAFCLSTVQVQMAALEPGGWKGHWTIGR